MPRVLAQRINVAASATKASSACGCAGRHVCGGVRAPVSVSAASISDSSRKLGVSSFAGSKVISASAKVVKSRQQVAIRAVSLDDEYYEGRTNDLRKHFPEALGQDDFLARTEIALESFGFNGDNTIAMTNLCRDEITSPLSLKIEDIFGNCFRTNGLGGVMTCGATGIGAGISHAPTNPDGREKYVFLAFPHIAINSLGEVGVCNREGRPGDSCACGALAAALGYVTGAEDLKEAGGIPGEHDIADPEMSILRTRLARRITPDQVASMDLVQITKIATELIASDLEDLLAQVVDPAKADWAVITGTQIHNWGKDYYDESDPNLEYLSPLACYAVIDGNRTDFDLSSVPGPTPRQLRLLQEPSRQRDQEYEQSVAKAMKIRSMA